MLARASSTATPQPQPMYTQGEVDFFCGRPSASMSHFLRYGNAQELPQPLQTAAEDLHRRQARGAHLTVLLLQDGMAVVQGVEALGDLQGVACDEREFQ